MHEAGPPRLEVEGLCCRHGRDDVVRGVSFALREGELGALLGASGSGKTTLLRAIAGLHEVAAGQVRLRGETVAAPGEGLPPERRGIGFVFQDHALFPHLTVAANVAFGLRRLDAAARAARVAELLDQLEIGALAERWPHELSGGQQQRVAVARALAPRPGLLLLDEPLASLDARLRTRLREALRRLLRHEGATALLVTHDQDEAFAFADRVGVLHAGRLEQWATPFDLYHRPATPYVAGFVGEGRLLRGQVAADGSLRTALGLLPAPAGHATGTELDVLVRPDDVVLSPGSALRAEVVGVAFRGAETLYVLRLDGGEEVCTLQPSHVALATGERVGIGTDLEHVVAFARAPAGKEREA